MITTYTVKSKVDDHVWEFKYDLNGNLKSFNVLSGILTPLQTEWLFKKGKFPIIEALMTTVWVTKLKKNFEIDKGEFDYSFEAWYNFYAHKHGKRKMTENSFNRLSKGSVVLLYKGTVNYKHFLNYHPTRQPQDPATFINQESYLNDWKV